MANINTLNTLKTIKIGKEPMVIFPLKKWKKIEEELENLEMYYSERLSKEIAKRRQEKETVSLERLLKKYRL